MLSDDEPSERVRMLADADLLSACRRGDQGAWEALINRFQKLIYAIPRRAGLADDQCADVFQDVFATLLEKLDTIEQPDRLQAWLVTTAKRKTWRIVTRGHRLDYISDDEEAGDERLNQFPDRAPLPDEALLKLEEQHRIRTAMTELDERCRHLLTLLFYHSEPPPYAEIARATGVPEGSIGPTRARCLQKLLRFLEK